MHKATKSIRYFDKKVKDFDGLVDILDSSCATEGMVYSSIVATYMFTIVVVEGYDIVRSTRNHQKSLSIPCRRKQRRDGSSAVAVINPNSADSRRLTRKDKKRRSLVYSM